MAFATLLLVGAPEALRRRRFRANATSRLAGSRVRAALMQKQPSAERANPTWQRRFQGQANELERPPSAAKVKATNSKPPRIAPAAYTRALVNESVRLPDRLASCELGPARLAGPADYRLFVVTPWKREYLSQLLCRSASPLIR